MANSRTTANSNKDNKDMKLSSESASENIVSGAILEQLERQETRIKKQDDQIQNLISMMALSQQNQQLSDPLAMSAFMSMIKNYNAPVIETNRFLVSSSFSQISKELSNHVINTMSWKNKIPTDHIKSYLDSVKSYATVLQVGAFLSLEEIVYVDGIIPTYAMPPTGTNIVSAGSTVPASTGLLAHDAVRKDVSVVESNTISESLNIVANCMMLSLAGNDVVRATANQSNAVDKLNAILMYNNLKSAYANSTGTSIFDWLLKLFRLKQSTKSHSWTITEFLTHVDEHAGQLAYRNYYVDNFILLAVLLNGLNLDSSARDEINKKITNGILTNDHLSYGDASRFLRLFAAEQIKMKQPSNKSVVI